MFSAVAEQLGLDYDIAVKVAGGFGGGMYLGSVCGAVTGGIMAIGVKHGGVGLQPGACTARLVRQFADRFAARHRSINCPDLIGIDLGKLDPLNKPDVFKTIDQKAFAVCPVLVRDAVTIVTELLNPAPAPVG